ncbi:hypothetical protein GGS24DRAFT_506236 [Hypoxylon argillaceum]|nr:hypothetical protein GGS24DRAFT_506236 [Hypoxylon argillaceum]
MFLVRRKRISPPAVLTDKVVPVHYWDHYSKDAVIDFTMRFDHKLDVGMLRRSLEKLLDRQDSWRRLGARVRLNIEGRLEYHVPAEYTKQRPAISFRHTPYSMSIKQHPTGSRLPTASAPLSESSSPTIVPGEGFVSLTRRPGDPTSFEDYLYTDRPMLGLHIVSFSDSTLVSLCSSHILFDAMGRKELLNAWSLTLQGREQEVLPLIETDPLATLGTQHRTTDGPLGSAHEPYQHASKQLGLLQLLTLGMRQTLDKILHSKATEESRIICVPQAFIDALRKDAFLALQPRNDKKPGEKAQANAFLSDGDILCAWWTRQIVSTRIRNTAHSSQTIAIMNMLGLRRLLRREKLLPESAGALIANAMVGLPAFIAARHIVGRPLGITAGILRTAIQELGTMAQVDALLGLQRAANSNGGIPALFGNAGMHMVVCTNWTQARFFELDFSAAVVPEEGEAEQVHGTLQMGPPGETDFDGNDRGSEQQMSAREPARRIARPTSVQMHLNSASTPAFMMSIFTVLGKDEVGNYWITGTLRKKFWLGIEQALREGPSQHSNKL